MSERENLVEREVLEWDDLLEQVFIRESFVGTLVVWEGFLLNVEDLVNRWWCDWEELIPSLMGTESEMAESSGAMVVYRPGHEHMIELPLDRLEVEVAEVDELRRVEVAEPKDVLMVESQEVVDQSDSGVPSLDLRSIFHRRVEPRQDPREERVEEASPVIERKSKKRKKGEIIDKDDILLDSPSSILTSGDLQRIRQAYLIGDDVEMCLPDVAEKANFAKMGWHCMYESSFRCGACLPFPKVGDACAEVLRHSPSSTNAQLMENTYVVCPNQKSSRRKDAASRVPLSVLCERT